MSWVEETLRAAIQKRERSGHAGKVTPVNIPDLENPATFLLFLHQHLMHESLRIHYESKRIMDHLEGFFPQHFLSRSAVGLSALMWDFSVFMEAWIVV